MLLQSDGLLPRYGLQRGGVEHDSSRFDASLHGGLGWHWDLGSTITGLLMLETSQGAGGELQLTDAACAPTTVALQRGDMAFYRSRSRHRVTSVRKRRRTLAIEWWRGPQTRSPRRPEPEEEPGRGWDMLQLQEPATRALANTSWSWWGRS